MSSSCWNACFGADFLSQDLEKLADILRKTKAGKTLKALCIGPPIDGVFAEECQSASAGLEAYFKASCPELQVLSGWDLSSNVPIRDGGWNWKTLESGALQGTSLSEYAFKSLSRPEL